MLRRPKYRFYATLLDGFQGYIGSSEIYQKYWGFSENPPKTEEEFEREQFQSLIDRINRVPFDSEAADRGTVFNEIVDSIILNQNSDKCELSSDKGTNTITAKYNERTFIFPRNMCIEVAREYAGAVPQYFTQGIIDTKYGPVLLYGYIDELMPMTVHDIKTKGKGKYKAFDFKNNWQHRVYPYCLHQEGILISDFQYDVFELDQYNILTGSHSELYTYVPDRDIPAITSHCEALIEFVETNRSIITDKKIFNE